MQPEKQCRRGNADEGLRELRADVLRGFHMSSHGAPESVLLVRKRAPPAGLVRRTKTFSNVRTKDLKFYVHLALLQKFGFWKISDDHI